MNETEPQVKYGLRWHPMEIGGKFVPYPGFFMHRDLALGRYDCDTLPNFKGRAWHFMRFCDFLFGDEQGLFHLQWNPNAVRIINAFFANKMVALLGSASSGKSYVLAATSVAYYLLSPKDTKVLVTSTTVQTAKGKIWGDISYAWDQAAVVYKSWGLPIPGKKMTGEPIVRYELDGVISHKSGIELVPTQQATEKQSMDKIQGYKNENVLFVGDEWDTLGHGLINTVRGNLQANANSRCLAAFNPTSRTSAGGRIAKPKDGWESIDMDSEEWETDTGGICLRFDALKSPNVLSGRNDWKGLPTIETIDRMKSIHGEDSVSWFSMVRGWFAPTGETNSIYSEAEVLLTYQADRRVDVWVSEPTMIAGLDPSFAHGGDGAWLVIGRVGEAIINDNRMVVCEEQEAINLDKEITDKTVDKSEQVVKLTAKHLARLKIDVKDLAVDITGAPSFKSLLSREIGDGFIGAVNNAKPSSMPISRSDRRKACDVYVNLMSELWYAGKPLLREGQLKGIDLDVVSEMCQRSYTGGTGKTKIAVEDKKQMKKRLHHSPDRADSYFLMLCVARTRHRLSSMEKPKASDSAVTKETFLQKYYRENPHLLPKPEKKLRHTYEQLEVG